MLRRMDLPPVSRRVDEELRALESGPVAAETVHELRTVIVNAFTELENELFIERGRRDRR